MGRVAFPVEIFHYFLLSELFMICSGRRQGPMRSARLTVALADPLETSAHLLSLICGVSLTKVSASSHSKLATPFLGRESWNGQ